MEEVCLDDYEPGCIEAIPANTGAPEPLRELLKGASYADQWLPRLEGSRRADAAICVFSPNTVENPQKCSLEYVGSFEYEVVHPDWFQRLLRGELPEQPGARDA